MKKTTTTTREYDDEGRLIKEFVTEVTEYYGPQPYSPSVPGVYPNTPNYPWHPQVTDGCTGAMGW